MELIADVGGTNTRCALVDNDGSPVHIAIYANSEYDSMLATLTSYLQRTGASPKAGAIAVAAPITGDSVRMTNRQWHFSIEELRQDLGLDSLQVINDFSAIALALPRLDDEDAVAIGTGQAVAGKTLAVLGPGTGLGVSALIPGSQGWVPLSGEGGHATLACVTEREASIVDAVNRRFGHCSAERLISGPGLALMYDILRELEGLEAANVDPPQVQALAARGDVLARECLEIFLALLGSFAGNVALLLGAVGGVFIGGGIAPAMVDRLAESDFRQRFVAKGRYTGYLQSIPTRVIVNKTPALLGLASLV